MRLRENSALSLLLPLILSVVLLGFLAACGGGQSEGGGQGNKQEGKAAGEAAGKVANEAAKKEPLQRKMAFGTVRAFKDDKRRLSLRPTVNAQGKKPLGFKVRKNAQFTLGGEKAEMEAIKEGQQAQISYVIKNEVNRAVVVNLFEPEEKPSRGGEKETGQPSDGGEKTG